MKKQQNRNSKTITQSQADLYTLGKRHENNAPSPFWMFLQKQSKHTQDVQSECYELCFEFVLGKMIQSYFGGLSLNIFREGGGGPRENTSLSRKLRPTSENWHMSDGCLWCYTREYQPLLNEDIYKGRGLNGEGGGGRGRTRGIPSHKVGIHKVHIPGRKFSLDTSRVPYTGTRNTLMFFSHEWGI